MPHGRPHRELSDDDKAYICDHYAGSRRSMQMLCRRFDASNRTIQQALEEGGRIKTGRSRLWTPEDEERMMGLLLEHSLEETARRLNRTPGAVTARRTKVNAKLRRKEGLYTVAETAERLGVSEEWVRHEMTRHRGILRPRGRRHRYAMEQADLISARTIYRALKERMRDIPGRNLSGLIEIVERCCRADRRS